MLEERNSLHKRSQQKTTEQLPTQRSFHHSPTRSLISTLCFTRIITTLFYTAPHSSSLPSITPNSTIPPCSSHHYPISITYPTLHYLPPHTTTPTICDFLSSQQSNVHLLIDKHAVLPHYLSQGLT